MKLMILGFEICHFDAKKESKKDPKESLVENMVFCDIVQNNKKRAM